MFLDSVQIVQIIIKSLMSLHRIQNSKLQLIFAAAGVYGCRLRFKNQSILYSVMEDHSFYGASTSNYYSALALSDCTNAVFSTSFHPLLKLWYGQSNIHALFLPIPGRYFQPFVCTWFLVYRIKLLPIFILLTSFLSSFFLRPSYLHSSY